MLFKILHGDESRISLDITPFHEGWAYVTHSGNYFIDMNIGTVESPNYQRVKLNANQADRLANYDIAAVLNPSDTELATSKAIFDALEALKAELTTQSVAILSEAQNDASNKAAVVLAEAQKGIAPAVNDAIAQAIASGEFNGKDGADGKDGVDGITPTIEISADGYWIINDIKTEYKAIGVDGTNGTNGVDGVTPTIEISDDGYWVINGTQTTYKAIGSDGKDGIDGTDGYTPVRGTDYWTEADKDEIKTYVDDLADDIKTDCANMAVVILAEAQSDASNKAAVVLAEAQKSVNALNSRINSLLEAKLDRSELNAIKQEIIVELKAHIDQAILGGEW